MTLCAIVEISGIAALAAIPREAERKPRDYEH